MDWRHVIVIQDKDKQMLIIFEIEPNIKSVRSVSDQNRSKENEIRSSIFQLV